MKAIASNGVEINTGDPVLVRNYDGNWIYTYFSHKVDNSDWPYVTSCTCFAQCIPFKGNEHLVGTDKDYRFYSEKQEQWIKENNIKVGDKVKIIKKSFQYDNGWEAIWLPDMNDAVNNIGIITDICIKGIEIKVINIGTFYYPYHILKKIEDKVEFKFGAKVRAVCEDNNKKIEGILIGYFPNYSYSYCIAINEQINNSAIGDTKWVKFIEYID